MNSIKVKLSICILIGLNLIIFIINLKLCVGILNRKKYFAEQLRYKQEIEEDVKNYYKNTVMQKVENFATFYNIKNCVEKYYLTLNYLWTNNSEQSINNEYVDSLLGLISDENKERFNLNKETISQKFSYLPKGKPIIYDAYEYNMETELSAYIVYGYYIFEDININKQEFNLMVLIDKNDKTFTIYLSDFLNEKGLNKLRENERLEFLHNIKSINNNSFNTIDNKILTDQKMAEDYYYTFSFLMQYCPELAYEKLDDKYKAKKFEKIGIFNNYLENKKNDLLILKSFNTKRYNDCKQYICIDENNSYYIFVLNNCLDYSVILDTYTVDIPEFIEKYELGDKQVKTALNIQKIVDALNDKDYKYVYSKLADSFKQNYFKTGETFTQYATNAFGEKIEVDYKSFLETSNYCTFDIILKNSQKEIAKTIIMQLQEGTDFVFSFNID